MPTFFCSFCPVFCRKEKTLCSSRFRGIRTKRVAIHEVGYCTPKILTFDYTKVLCCIVLQRKNVVPFAFSKYSRRKMAIQLFTGTTLSRFDHLTMLMFCSCFVLLSTFIQVFAFYFFRQTLSTLYLCCFQKRTSVTIRKHFMRFEPK